MGLLNHKQGRDMSLDLMNKEKEDKEQEDFDLHMKKLEREERIIHYAGLAINAIVSHYGAVNPKTSAKQAFEIAIEMYDKQIELFE